MVVAAHGETPHWWYPFRKYARQGGFVCGRALPYFEADPSSHENLYLLI